MFHELIIPTLITAFTDPRTLGSIIVAGTSFGTFWIAFHKGSKTEQMKIAMEISTKLDEADNKIFQLEDELKKVSIKVSLQRLTTRYFGMVL